MKSKLSTLALALGVLALPGAAHAALYNVVQTQYQVAICKNINATGPLAAFQQCQAKFGNIVPAGSVVIEQAPSCKSTHRIVPQNGTAPKWAYDRRFVVPRPECP